MRRSLAIVGAGGHGREALGIARAVNKDGHRWDRIGFTDDGPVDADRLSRLGARMFGDISVLDEVGFDHVIAIGDPETRRRIAVRIGPSSSATTLIDPSANLGLDVILGDGVIIHPGVVITTNVRIGRHSHLNCSAVVSHDCRIGEFSSISPGVMLNGGVNIEDHVFLGTGAIVLPGVTVGQGAVVGAGSVVCDDVAPDTVVAGAPARPMRRTARTAPA